MIKDLTPFYSKNALNMKRSEIRELLKFTRQPDIISFAGGLRARYSSEQQIDDGIRRLAETIKDNM